MSSSNNANIGGDNYCRFIDLVDMAAFARLLESFYLATGIPNGVVDSEGGLLSMSCGTNACAVFHRASPETAERCRNSNIELVRDLREGCVAGGLCRNGLMDYATPVIVESRQLATLYLGQVLHTPPDMEFFRAQAVQFGFDTNDYLSAIKAIPVVDKKRLDDLMGVMVGMAQMLAASGLARLRQVALEREINAQAERNIQLKAILDFFPVAIGWSDEENRIEYVNRQFIQLFGYTLDDLPNLASWYRLAYPDEGYREKVVNPWLKAVLEARQNQTDSPELEANITCKDGSMRSVVVRAAWVGHRRMVSFSDITERKRIESVLRHSQEMLADAQKLAQLGSWDWDVVEDRVEWSEMAYQIYTPDQRPAEPGFGDFKSSIHPDDRLKVVAAVESAFELDAPFELDHRVVSVGKGVCIVHAQGKVFRDANGKPIRMVGTVQDITERKQLEDTLRLNEALSHDHARLLQAVLESSPEVIVFALNHDYRYLAFNEKHRATMQAIWGKEITVGMNMLEVIGEHPDREKAKLGFDRALTGEAFVTEDAYGDEAILRMYWQNFFAPIRGEDGSTVGLTCFVLNISERRHLKLALAAREQEFRSLAESSPDVVIRVDRDLRIRYLNANMVKALELDSAQEVIGRRSSEIWPDGRFNEIDALRERVADAGQMESIEVVVPALGGKKAYHQVISVPECDTDGHVIGTLTFGRDITVIRETERRLNSLVENLPGVIFTIRVSPQGELSFPYVSAGVEEIYGISPETAMGDFAVMHGMVHPDDKAGMMEAYAESTRTLTPFRVEVRICPPGQAVRWIDVRSDPQVQPDGGILSYGLIFDITERKRLEQALAEREREMRSLVENLPDNIARYTTDARHTYVCPSLERLFGVPKEFFLGRTPSECSPDDSSVEAERRIRAVAATGVSDEMEYLFELDGTTQYHQIRFVAECDEADRIVSVLSIGTDITQRKQTNLRLEQAYAFTQNLLNAIPDPVFAKDRQHRWVLVNDALCKLLGKPRTELLGKSEYDFLPAEQANIFCAKDELVFSSGQVNINEEVITDARQRLRQIQTKKTLADDDTLIGVIRDMTESIATRKMLAEAQRLARLGSWDWDVVHNRVEWSDMAYDIYTPDGRPEDPGFEDFKQSLHPDDLERVVAAVQAALDHDTPFDLDHRVVSVCMGVRVVHAQAKVFRGADGKPLRMVGTVQDVTENRQMAEALAIREREFRTLAEHLPDVMVRYDREARFVYGNPMFENMVGVGLDKVLGKTPTQVTGLPDSVYF